MHSLLLAGYRPKEAACRHPFIHMLSTDTNHSSEANPAKALGLSICRVEAPPMRTGPSISLRGPPRAALGPQNVLIFPWGPWHLKILSVGGAVPILSKRKVKDGLPLH